MFSLLNATAVLRFVYHVCNSVRLCGEVSTTARTWQPMMITGVVAKLRFNLSARRLASEGVASKTCTLMCDNMKGATTVFCGTILLACGRR